MWGLRTNKERAKKRDRTVAPTFHPEVMTVSGTGNYWLLRAILGDP